jgi:penicillin-binding protein A
MLFAREINRLLLGLLLVFAVVALSAAYWAIVGADTILLREDNPRLVEREARILRGQIYDRNGTLLVDSVQNADGSVSRLYLYPETASALGYYSLRYGVGGAEAAYDTLLRGDDLLRKLGQEFGRQLLHQPQQGSDIQLTFDLDIQQAITQAMKNHQGAAVVIAVPSGEILALVSLPDYDPNNLDDNWETLTTAPGNPFFNRAVQGSYQPGATLQTPLMAAALLTGHSLEVEIEQATRALDIDDVTLTCAVPLPEQALTLRDAYAFACPYPFALLSEELGDLTLQAMFDTFRFDQPPTLEGFVPQVEGQVTPQALPQIDWSADNLLKNALGQGELTVTPLEMALITAAIINDGNAPSPTTLVATRLPQADEWTATAPSSNIVTPFLTMQAARQLEDLMRNTVANGAAQNAGRTNIDIGGHAALAYSGDGTQAWFIGFATLAGNQGIATAIVLENSRDLGLAADIGGTALQIAHSKLSTE